MCFRFPKGRLPRCFTGRCDDCVLHSTRKEDIMKDDHDRYTDAWLDKLDAIVAGDDVPLADDDQLLPVAKRLATALAPLRTMDSAAERRRQNLLTHLRVKHSNITRKPIRRLFRPSLLIAALL